MAAKPVLSLAAVVFALLGLYLIYADSARSNLESRCTLTVVGTLAGGKYNGGSAFFHVPPGYPVDYDYVIDGNGYRGHDKLTERPAGYGAVNVHYDPDAPSQSVLELGRWRVILSWGVASLVLALVMLIVLATGYSRKAAPVRSSRA